MGDLCWALHALQLLQLQHVQEYTKLQPDGRTALCPSCSPFGIYLLHTDGGSLVCDDADEAAQMLFLTLQRLSNAIDARPWYVVSELMMPRYETAVAAYLADTETEAKKWSALTYEARSMYELGVVMALNDQSKELQEILRCGRM